MNQAKDIEKIPSSERPAVVDFMQGDNSSKCYTPMHSLLTTCYEYIYMLLYSMHNVFIYLLDIYLMVFSSSCKVFIFILLERILPG